MVRILIQFQLRDVFKLPFVEGVLPDMGARLVTRKKHQTIWELWEAPVSLGAWEVNLYGGFLLLVACASHHLPSKLTFRAYNNLILKTGFLLIS